MAIRPHFRNRTIIQNAHIVVDVHEAAWRWQKAMNIGPFYISEEIKLKNVTYRGQPAELSLAAASVMSGNLHIELIQQLNKGPSAYRDVVPEGAEGFHHVCFFTDNYDEELARYEAMGCVAATTGEVARSSMRFCYIDTRSIYGSMIELVDQPGGPSWDYITTAARQWDGKTDPVRKMPSPAEMLEAERGGE